MYCRDRKSEDGLQAKGGPKKTFAVRLRGVVVLTGAEWGQGRLVGANFVALVQYYSLRECCRVAS